MSLKIDEIAECLNRLQIDKDTYNKLIEELEQTEAEKKEERAASKEKKAKNEFIVFVRGDDELKKTLQQAWVCQVPAETETADIVSKLQEAAGEHNANCKRKKNYIERWGDLFEYIKRPFVKSRNVNIKTKTPVQVIVLTGEQVGEIPVA